MHLNCSKEIGCQQNVLTGGTVRLWAGLPGEPLAPPAWEAGGRFGSILGQGMEPPETSWTALASDWLEFCTSPGKYARHKDKSRAIT